MEYQVSDYGLKKYYGVCGLSLSTIHSWLFAETERLDFCTVRDRILEISSEEYFYLCIQMAINTIAERHMKIDEILLKDYGIHSKTIAQNQKREYDTWLCEGMAEVRRSQVDKVLYILSLFPYSSFVVSSTCPIGSEHAAFFISEMRHSPVASVCFAALQKGFGFLHIIRGADGTSINYGTREDGSPSHDQ